MGCQASSIAGLGSRLSHARAARLRLTSQDQRADLALTGQRPQRRLPPMPAKKPSNHSEARRTNVLLEAIQKDITLLSEGFADVHREVDGLKTWRTKSTEELDLIKAIVRQNADDVSRLTEDMGLLKRVAVIDHPKRFDAVELQLKLLRDDVKTLTRRLETAEAKLPA